MEVYRDGQLYLVDKSNNEDVVLKDLPFGLYSAKLYDSRKQSEETKWIVVDYMVDVVADEKIILSSKNTTPERFEYKLIILYIESIIIFSLMSYLADIKKKCIFIQ